MAAEAAKAYGENKSSTREIVEKEVGAGLLLPLENAGTGTRQRVRRGQPLGSWEVSPDHCLSG